MATKLEDMIHNNQKIIEATKVILLEIEKALAMSKMETWTYEDVPCFIKLSQSKIEKEQVHTFDENLHASIEENQTKNLIPLMGML